MLSTVAPLGHNNRKKRVSMSIMLPRRNTGPNLFEMDKMFALVKNFIHANDVSWIRSCGRRIALFFLRKSSIQANKLTEESTWDHVKTKFINLFRGKLENSFGKLKQERDYVQKSSIQANKLTEKSTWDHNFLAPCWWWWWEGQGSTRFRYLSFFLPWFRYFSWFFT